MTNYYELYENGDVFFDVINEIKRKYLANTKDNIIKQIRGIMVLEHDIRNVLKCNTSESFTKACGSYGNRIYKEVDRTYFANRYSVNKIDTLCEFLDPTSNKKIDGWKMTPAAYNIKLTIWREKDIHNAYYFVIRVDYMNSIITNTIEEIKKWYALYEIDEYTSEKAPDMELSVYQNFDMTEADVVDSDININERARRLFNVEDVVSHIAKEENMPNLMGIMNISDWLERYNLKKYIDNMHINEILAEKI